MDFDDQLVGESYNYDPNDLMDALKDIERLININKNQEKDIKRYKENNFVEEVTQLNFSPEEIKKVEEVLRKQLQEKERKYDKLE